MLHQTNSVFPSVAKHVFQMYYDVSALVTMQEGYSVLLQSEVDVHQGDPLGPALFALTIHPFLVNLQNIYPEIQVLAYLDDVFLMGTPADVINAFNSVCLLPGAGLEHLYPRLSSPCQVQRHCYFGIANWYSRFVSSYCSSFANSGNCLCDQLVALNDVQSASLLLRYCHVPCLNYLARTVCPSLLSEAAEIHNLQTRSVFSNLLSYNHLSDSVWWQAFFAHPSGRFRSVLS